MLLTDISDIRAMGGKIIDVSADFTGIEPFIELAQQKYLVKAIGQTYLSFLEDQASIDALSAIPKAATEAVKLKLKKALAFYAYYEYAPFSMANSGDSGLQETEAQGTKPARLWVYNTRVVKAIEQASSILEGVLEELISNSTNYLAWKASDKFAQYNSVFLKTGAEMLEAYPPTGGSYRLFATLSPYVRKIDRDVLGPLISPTFLASLLSRQAGSASTAEDIKLHPYLREVEATGAYTEALEFMIVTVTDGGGLRVMSDFDGLNSAVAPRQEQLDLIRNKAKDAHNASIGKLKRFLEINIEDYPEYSGSSAYKPLTSLIGFANAEAYNTIFPMR